jgi:pSer/pThr/pTyr-binding forkhead associated (FHA) protein
MPLRCSFAANGRLTVWFFMLFAQIREGWPDIRIGESMTIPAYITLTIIQDDDLENREFVFDEPAECIIGRAADCDIQIPTDNVHVDVSRHHCVLEIHPPHIQVRDLGSLNGTFVNDRKIGQRPPNQPSEESGLWPSAAHALKTGDELSVGHVVFRVLITVGATAQQGSHY